MRTVVFSVLCLILVSCERPSASSALPPIGTNSIPSGAFGRGFETIYQFEGGPKDGSYPDGPLTVQGHLLYGTTVYGGGSPQCPTYFGCGTIFTVTTSGRERIIYRFYPLDGKWDGTGPYSSLPVLDGMMYGVTAFGGRYGLGTVFQLSSSGKERVIYSFEKLKDGTYPERTLITLGSALYGTSEGGEKKPQCPVGCGTVYRITAHGAEEVLHRFTGAPSGETPIGLLAMSGKFFGGTSEGGSLTGPGCSVVGCGTLYAMDTSGQERIVYRFRGAPDSRGPGGNLIELNQTLFGTSFGGGSGCGSLGCGTVFAATPSGTERVVYSFKGARDGETPLGGLVAVNGALYGVTEAGGGSGCTYGAGCGTIFKVTPAGKEQVLYRFSGGSDGAAPVAGLTLLGGALYGTTSSGGINNNGTIFKITP